MAPILGLFAEIAPWAFEPGTDIAGLDRQSKDELAQQLGCIEAEKLELKADLRLLQRLQLAASQAGLTLCSMRATLDSRAKTRYQLLAMHNGTGAAECASHYAIVPAGTRNGRPWNCGPAGTAKPLHLRQYVRVEAGASHRSRPW